MKVLLVNGSPNENGCTYTALDEVARTLQKEGLETEIYQLGKKPVQGCIACDKCKQGRPRCVFNDEANLLADKISSSDGLVLGSPVYYAGPNGSLCALLDRVFYSAWPDFSGIISAAVVACRRAGSTAALDRLNRYFTITRMPVAPSQYWNMVHGTTPDEVRRDEEGLQTMRTLAREMARLIKATQNTPPPAKEEEISTNFIR